MIPGMAALVADVQRNCNIADARHAREVTLCTYLLGMREFYRWEHEIPYGVAPPRADVGRWISEREALWEEIAEEPFSRLQIGAGDYDPFDAPAVNRALAGTGLVYGGGVGRFGKPHFFLARLAREERRGGAHLLICDCEYARDITAMPAALQHQTIVVRREALRQWLWEKAEGWSVKRQEGVLKEVLDAYHFDADPARAIERMTDAETETLILHEEGEYRAGEMLGPGWATMMDGFKSKRPELLARAIRDNLADCLVTLPTLIERQAWDSLSLWLAGFDGMRRELFPSLVTALSKVGADETTALQGGRAKDALLAVADGGTALAAADALLQQGRDHWLRLANELMTLDQSVVEQRSHRLCELAL